VGGRQQNAAPPDCQPALLCDHGAAPVRTVLGWPVNAECLVAVPEQSQILRQCWDESQTTVKPRMPRDPTMRFALPLRGRALAGSRHPIVDDDSVLDDAVRRFISDIMNAQPPTRRSQADRLAALGYLKMGPLREAIRRTDRPQKHSNCR
jgi:hypothetical protein